MYKGHVETKRILLLCTNKNVKHIYKITFYKNIRIFCYCYTLVVFYAAQEFYMKCSNMVFCCIFCLCIFCNVHCREEV